MWKIKILDRIFTLDVKNKQSSGKEMEDRREKKDEAQIESEIY